MVTLEKYYGFTAQQEYKKNPKLSPVDVQELLNWSNENIKLHGKIIELEVIMFLHAYGYDKEYAKKAIHQKYTLRAKKCYSFFSLRDPVDSFIQNILNVIYINITHNKDTGFSYVWVKLKSTDVSQYYPKVIIKTLFMAIELDQIKYGTKPGYTILIDSKQSSISHALRYSVHDVRNAVTYIQDASSIVIDQICYLNANIGTKIVYSLAKSFMSSSMIDKVTMITADKTNEFLKILPQTVVPKDYSGLATNMNELNNILNKNLLENREYFLNEEQLRNGNVTYEVDTKIDEVDNKI